jgi:hypothetical protein
MNARQMHAVGIIMNTWTYGRRSCAIASAAETTAAAPPVYHMRIRHTFTVFAGDQHEPMSPRIAFIP